MIIVEKPTLPVNLTLGDFRVGNCHLWTQTRPKL